MFCEKCGSKLEDGSIFCSECGYKLEDLFEEDVENDNDNDIDRTVALEEDADRTVALDMGNKSDDVDRTVAMDFGNAGNDNKVVNPINPINPIAKPAAAPTAPKAEVKKPVTDFRQAALDAAKNPQAKIVPKTPNKILKEPEFVRDDNETVSINDAYDRTVSINDSMDNNRTVAMATGVNGTASMNSELNRAAMNQGDSRIKPLPLPPQFEEEFVPATDIPERPYENVEVKKKKSAAPIIILIVIIFLLLGVGGGVAYYFFIYSAEDSEDSDKKGKKDKEDGKDEDDEDGDEDGASDSGNGNTGEANNGGGSSTVVEEEKFDPAKVYDKFFNGEETASFVGEDATYAELNQFVIEHDKSFINSSLPVALGNIKVEYAYCDWDGDDIEELFIRTANSNGFDNGSFNYMVVGYVNDEYEVLAYIYGEEFKNVEFYDNGMVFYDNGDRASNIEFTDSDDDNYTKDDAESDGAKSISPSYKTLSEQYWNELVVSQEALEAYVRFINNEMNIELGDGNLKLKDFYGDHEIDYYFVVSKDNDIPVLIFRDYQELYPAAAVVYHKGVIAPLVFYAKWTFTSIDEPGSVGGIYNNCIYTSKCPWGSYDNISTPKDMVFYTINLESFALENKYAVIVASEGDFEGVNGYDSYDSYMDAIEREFPQEVSNPNDPSQHAYVYYYTDGDGYIDQDGNSYDSVDEIAASYCGNYTCWNSQKTYLDK